MLMQNFMTAEALDLTDQEYAALVTTLGMLDRGELKHVPGPAINEHFPLAFSGHFNMQWWNQKHACGSVCCIGGAAEVVGNLQMDSLNEKSNMNINLGNLFYPDVYGHEGYEQITVEQAAAALRNYLRTGEARWEEILE